MRSIIPRETQALIHEAVNSAIDAAQARTAEAMKNALSQLPSRGSKLLTVQQTIEYLNTSRAALYRLEQTGVLIPKRFGRKVLYEISKLDAHIARAGQTRR
jgi:hypothetical protein